MVVTIISISVSDTDAQWHDITNIYYKVSNTRREAQKWEKKK